jgi:hypothetical protein
MIDKSKAEKMVALKPGDWEKIVNYLSAMNVPFIKADKAVEILNIISGVKWLDVVIEDENEQK